jgi:hypothetical protein
MPFVANGFNARLTEVQEAHLTMDHYVEIVGKVQSDLSIRVLLSTDFGTNLGMLLRV